MEITLHRVRLESQRLMWGRIVSCRPVSNRPLRAEQSAWWRRLIACREIADLLPTLRNLHPSHCDLWGRKQNLYLGLHSLQ
jgi:hypothetical protein